MATTELPPEIQDLDDFTESINILCHADTGAGKTVMWSKLPKLLILAVEEGTISAKRRGSNAKVWKIKHHDELVKAFEWLRDSLEDGTCPFDWVLIDSITKVQTRVLSAILELAVKNNSHRDPDVPAIQDHFKWQLVVKRLVTDFNELPINVVWLARSMNKEDPEGEDIVVPNIEGKDYQISSWVCGEMQLLCYLKKEKKGDKMVRKLYTNDHPLYWCKDRYDILPHVITNPDANKIVKAIIDSGATPDMGARSTVKSTARTKSTTRTKKVAKKGTAKKRRATA